MRKLTLFSAAVFLVLFAGKALCHETTLSFENDSLKFFRYEDMREEGPVERSVRTGRFLSVDPGKDWDPKQPQSWNMYSYVRNNPINATDPNGKEIQYTDAYKALVRTNPTYALAHRTWYNSPQGRAQHAKMGNDVNTVYRIGTGFVSETGTYSGQKAGGTGPPERWATRDKNGNLDAPEVNVTINIDFLSTGKLDARAASETLFHEVTHALDVGSGSLTREEAERSHEKLEEQDGTRDKRLEQYRRTLDEMLPPQP